MIDWKELIQKLIAKEKNKAVKLDLDNKIIEYSPKIKDNRNLRVITGDEEICRAFLINRLVNKLHYKEEYVELEKTYKYKTIGRPKIVELEGRIDVIVKDENNNPFLFIEIKEPKEWERDKDYIEGQLFNLAEEEQKKYYTRIKYLVYYTIEEKNTEIIDKCLIIDFQKYPSYGKWKDEGFPSMGDEIPAGYNKPKKIPKKKGDKQHDLRTEINRDDINKLSTNLHNVLWGGGGTNDSEIFYSLVNIILAKIQDESEKEDGQEYDFQVYSYGDNIESHETIFERINELYKRALNEKLNVTDENELSQAIVIQRNKFPLTKLIYTVQQLENYSFLEGRSSLDGRDILGDFFEQITRDGFKQTKGQFFTPNSIVRFLFYALQIDKLAIEKLNTTLELPYMIDLAAGSGTFLIEAMKIITKEVKYKQKHKLKTSRQVKEKFDELFYPEHKENRWAKEYIYGAEINFDLGTASKVNMILHGDGSTNIFVKDGLLPFRFYDKDTAPNYLRISGTDTLYNDKEVNGKFDVIVSNPPFSVNLDNETKNYLKQSFLFGDKKNSENLFIERWYQILKEKGRLAVVLPESVFDTTENKYIRLFIFKYFKVKAVVSLPQLTFEPYTSTKTSLLFAQKKTKQEINEWNDLWNKHGKIWSQLQTRIKNYVKVFIDNERADDYPSIKKDTGKIIKTNIKKLLKELIVDEDLSLGVKEILVKYEKEINEISTYENDLKDIFGYYNTWWVFAEVTNELNYKIFMAEIENVGYKRTKRGEKTMPNDLFDIEIAPNHINRIEIYKEYDEKIETLQLLKEEVHTIVSELQKSTGNIIDNKKNKIKTYEEQIEKFDVAIKNLKVVKNQVASIIDKFFEKSGSLKNVYYERTQPELLNHFRTGLLKHKKSDDVLLRMKETIKVLDYIRKDIIWD